MKTCVVCGVKFEGRPNCLYCSPACRRRKEYQRRGYDARVKYDARQGRDSAQQGPRP